MSFRVEVPPYSNMECPSDCRFCYFWEKGTDAVTDIAKGEWRARYVRHWYEKDKLIPVNPAKVPQLDEATLGKFPPGYRFGLVAAALSLPS